MKKNIVAALALALLAGSVYAAEWNFYGEAKVYTVWFETDEIDGEDSDTQFAEGLYEVAAIGANVKVSDELTGCFEYAAADGEVDVLLLYGEWNFGSGTLIVGKAFSPINITYSNQLVAGEEEDLGLGGFGDFDQSEIAQVKLTLGGFSIAIIDPETDNATYVAWEEEYDEGEDSDLWNDDYDMDRSTQTVIPMIALNYKATFDMGEVQIAGAYNRVEVTYDTEYGSYEEDVDSYAVGLGGNLNFGAFSIFATGVWGENIFNLGTETATQFGGRALVALGTDDGESWADSVDCESIGGTIGVTFAVNDMLVLEAGYGYIHDELDTPGDTMTDIAQSYYLQAAVTLAPGVTVTPEVGMIDERETGQDETLYFGAAWAISF